MAKPSKIPATQDLLFGELSRTSGIPFAFLKSLAWHETRFDAHAVSPTNVPGMFQCTSAVRNMYNKKNGTKWTRDEMFDPYKCGLVACFLLNLIVDEYKQTGVIKPENFTTFWRSSVDVGLIYLGYTAGWTREQGVPAITGRMREKGVEITVPKVIETAGILYPKSKIYVDPKKRDANGFGPYMSDPSLLPHIDHEVTDYFANTQVRAEEIRASSFAGAAVAFLGIIAVGAMIANAET